MSITVLACLIVSPHSHVHDLLLLALPAILTLPGLSPLNWSTVKDLRLKAWSAILLIYPLASWFIYCAGMFWIFTLINGALLCLALLHVFNRDAKDAQTKTQPA